MPSLWLAGCGGGANAYVQTNLVANSAAYSPQIVEPNLINAWGIAIRPSGQGGHFWVTGMGTSFEYVGDVFGQPLQTDELKTVALPSSGTNVGNGNGVVFNEGQQFVITQQHANGFITAPARFIFVSDNGVLSAWTERKLPNGKFDWPSQAITVVDEGEEGSSFFGLAISPAQDQLFVADFGANPLPRLRIFNAQFVEEPLGHRFKNPFIKDGIFKVGDFAPFNVQCLSINGRSSVFVTYVSTQEDPDKPGQLLAGEELAGPGRGRLAEYTAQGELVAVWGDCGMLNGPWGVVVAPDNFGPFSNQLLVSNFSDGTILGFDTTTKLATDFMKDEKGQVLKIEGLWNLIFGNGQSLGDTNALYFAAGPNNEADGLFGSLRWPY